MNRREHHTHGHCIKLDFLSYIMSGWGCLQKWCGIFQPAVEQIFTGSLGAHLNDVLSAPCQKEEPSWPGQRAQSPAAAGDMEALLLLHNCF